MEGEPAGILLQGLDTPGQCEHREMPAEVLRARGMPGRCEAGLPWGSSQGCCCLILSYFWAGEHLQLGLSALSPSGSLGSSPLSVISRRLPAPGGMLSPKASCIFSWAGKAGLRLCALLLAPLPLPREGAVLSEQVTDGGYYSLLLSPFAAWNFC